MGSERILVVEDEPKLARLVREVLSATGYTVETANNGMQAIELVALEQPDLVLLDIVLIGELDGFEVARRVRKFSDVPIIMLTAKARESDTLHGFDAGADDYITKPFSSKELLARIRAVLKRSHQESGEKAQSEIVCGELCIDVARRRVTIGDDAIHLTRTEFNLLQELAVHRNQVMEHAQLLTAVWGPDYRDDLDYLRAYIRYLRRKLESDPADPRHIVTYQGVGYMLACPDEPR